VKLFTRAAIPADVPAMKALEKHAATAAHWSASQYDSLFQGSGPRRVALIVQEDACIHGFIVARIVGQEWEIENIAIAGPARKRGLGTRLLGELLDLARAQGARAASLEVRESNRAARVLYEKWAFLEIGRRPRYYNDPQEDAILYRLDLA
jgi:ribosomal-protein-alanine N-acetyltransferase